MRMQRINRNHWGWAKCLDNDSMELFFGATGKRVDWKEALRTALQKAWQLSQTLCLVFVG